MSFEFNSNDTLLNDFPNPIRFENFFLLLASAPTAAGGINALVTAKALFAAHDDKTAALTVAVAALVLGIAGKLLVQVLSQMRFYLGRKFPLGLAVKLPLTEVGIAHGAEAIMETMRTARSMTSGEYLGCFFITPFSQIMKPLQTRGGSHPEPEQRCPRPRASIATADCGKFFATEIKEILVVSICKVRHVRGMGAAIQAQGMRLGTFISTKEELAARKACVKALWNEMDEASDDPALDGRGNDGRAIRSLQSYYTALNGERPDLERSVRASARWEEYNAELRACQEQDERLRTRLPGLAWQAAKECVSSISTDAVRWLQVGDKEFVSETVYHIVEIGLANRFRNPADLRISSDMDLTSDRFWRQLIRSGGGAKYFVCHAVATAMVYHFSEVANTVQSRGGDLDVFVNPLLIKLLKNPCNVWTDRYQPIVIALAHTPEPHRENLVVRLNERHRAMHGIYEYAQEQCDAAGHEVSLLEKQTATLRKRVTTAEAAFAQVQASNRALQESLKRAASKTAASATPEGQERAVESYARSLREKSTHLEKLRNALANTTDELARTREFLSVVLEPPSGVTLAPVEVRPNTHPEKWRIVFVGGHERLHSKLRKQMRNAVFLHPDQSHFSPEVFNGADAVVFSIGYCSHALTYRSANEVRRRGLRAGYSNFSNVEIVLEEIRAILFPGDGPGQLEGGVTA